MHSTQDCECCQASRLNAEGRPNWKRCGAGGKENQHIRHDGDGTLIKLEVNYGVYTMEVWVCLGERRLAGTVGGETAFDQPVRPAAV